MSAARLPLTDPWTMVFVAHSRDRVIVHAAESCLDRMPEAEKYVLEAAAFETKPNNGGGIAYYVRPERWPNVCRLVGMAANAPDEAMFEAWVCFLEAPLPPGSAAPNIVAGRRRSPWAFRQAWNAYHGGRERDDEASTPPFAGPYHGPEGSDA